MMYGNFAGGWMWLGGILLLLILAALIVLIVRAFTADTPSRGGGGRPPSGSPARQIMEERLARGEITPEEFRQLTRALEEHS
jgi:putative membrane protein